MKATHHSLFHFARLWLQLWLCAIPLRTVETIGFALLRRSVRRLDYLLPKAPSIIVSHATLYSGRCNSCRKIDKITKRFQENRVPVVACTGGRSGSMNTEGSHKTHKLTLTETFEAVPIPHSPTSLLVDSPLVLCGRDGPVDFGFQDLYFKMRVGVCDYCATKPIKFNKPNGIRVHLFVARPIVMMMMQCCVAAALVPCYPRGFQRCPLESSCGGLSKLHTVQVTHHSNTISFRFVSFTAT